MAEGEWARFWQHEHLPGVDLLKARYVRHTFTRHSHEGYVFGAVSGGVEDVFMPDGTVHAGPGSVILINPEVPHSARAGVPEGWVYSTLYPSAEVVARIAEETTTLRGTPGFGEVDVHDPEGAHLIREVHRAAEEGNALAADTVLKVLVARLLRRHGSALPARARRSAGARNALRARAVLEERMTEPPTLEALAAELGTSPFALLRAFKQQYGMPPHSWLTNARVRRARELLDTGTAPAEAAAAVGFTDQPHLNRHFSRIVGVPPGAYQRGRGAPYEIGRPVREAGGARGAEVGRASGVEPGRGADGTGSAARKNVQDRSETLHVPSRTWQNSRHPHHPHLYVPKEEPPRG
ncbi:AraC family transcriptional regulator [Streptomyces indicus]|uniref:AraC-type DNA-binding protein n=1 Tax=Streptomyces indicus TaxID=417292 RepID=A0A1G9B2T8_9ACTN|nr:AraC family transcriptional regulator [Streptomyces indicus]SDK33778.1 AraC-type DNA-binding protein [Streptomyces indicus]